MQWVPAIAGQLKKVLGLDVATDISVQNANSAQEGRFTLAVGPDVPGQSAQAGLNWMTVAPTKVGESANTGNWARADSPQAQALVARMSATNSIAAQQKLAYQIEEIMVDQRFTAPIAPDSWSIAYTSRRWTNWPSQQNYYAVPENGLGDLITTILNLTPTAAVSQDSS